MISYWNSKLFFKFNGKVWRIWNYFIKVVLSIYEYKISPLHLNFPKLRLLKVLLENANHLRSIGSMHELFIQIFKLLVYWME